jgi:hypothetical protein
MKFGTWNVRSLYRAGSLTAEVMEVAAAAAQKFDGERFNLRKLNELEVRKQYQIDISNRFAALENLSDSKDINKA